MYIFHTRNLFNRCFITGHLQKRFLNSILNYIYETFVPSFVWIRYTIARFIIRRFIIRRYHFFFHDTIQFCLTNFSWYCIWKETNYGLHCEYLSMQTLFCCSPFLPQAHLKVWCQLKCWAMGWWIYGLSEIKLHNWDTKVVPFYYTSSSKVIKE